MENNDNKKMTLYDISVEQLRINTMLEENGGELTPEIEEALAINEGNFLTKAEGYAATIEKYGDFALLCKAKKDDFANKQRVAENIVKRLKEKLQDAMEQFGYEEVKIGLKKACLRKSQAVFIEDATQIPNAYIKVETSIDKASLRDALKAGEEVKGACLVTNKSIQIR